MIEFCFINVRIFYRKKQNISIKSKAALQILNKWILQFYSMFLIRPLCLAPVAFALVELIQARG